MPISTKKKDFKYIEKYWEPLAAVAWKEYLDRGRGALIVDFTSDKSGDAVYSSLEELTKTPLYDEGIQMVKDYDPRRQVVLIFLRLPDSVSGYKGGIAEWGTPPEIYEEFKDRFAN